MNKLVRRCDECNNVEPVRLITECPYCGHGFCPACVKLGVTCFDFCADLETEDFDF